MRVLLVPEPMLGLPAEQVGEIVARAWTDATDGRSQVRVVQTTPDAQAVEVVTVPDPWGRPVPASIALTDGIAVLETSAAAGLDRSAPGDDPLAASSAGIGELVLAACRLGARAVVLPLDDLACHDGGAGLVATLAAGRAASGGELGGDAVAAARARLADVRLVGRYEDDAPLLGLNGASATQAEAKGMSPEQSQAAENAMGVRVDRVRREIPEPRDLVTGSVVRRDRQPGAGAGGGLGHGVLLLGGTLEESAPARARDIGLVEAVRAADLVVCTTGRFDWRVLRSSLVKEAATLAADDATPVVLVAGEGEAGRREAMALGVAGLYEVVESHRQRRAVLAEPVSALAARVTRVARTWDPTR